MRKDSTTAKLTDREIERNKRIFTPLNPVWILFNRGPRCATSPAQLNRVPCGKFNRVKAVFWDQSSSRQSQAGSVYNDHEEQSGCLV